MKSIVFLLTLVWVAACHVAPCRAQEGSPGVDDLRRRMLAAEDRRFKRSVELAQHYVKLGRLKDARRLYDEALTLRPGDVDVTETLLPVLRRLADHEAQIPLYRKLTSIHPGDATLHFRMGECLWRLKRAGEARKVWDDLLKRFPTERTVYDVLIEFYVAEGQLGETRGMIGRYRERFAEDAGLLLMESRLALSARQPLDALQCLLHVLELDLSQEESRRAEALLLDVARRTGRTAEVARRLTTDLETIDARLAGRLLGLAKAAAEGGNLPEAIDLAQSALPYVTVPDKRAEVTALIARWRAGTPK